MANLVKAPTKDFVSTTLNGTIDDSVSTITLTSTSNLQAPGYVVIDREDSSGTSTPNKREVVYYTGISGSDLTGCVRGADNSTARSHNSSAIVETNMTVGTWNNRMVVANNEPFQAWDSTNTVRNLINLNASDQIVIGANNVADHTVINAGTSKLVKRKVARKNVSSLSYKENTVTHTGWDFIAGDNTASISKTILFGFAFSEVPILVVTPAGYLDDSDPTDLSHLTGNPNIYNAKCYNSTVTGATIVITREDGTTSLGASNRRLGFSYIAEGQLN